VRRRDFLLGSAALAAAPAGLVPPGRARAAAGEPVLPPGFVWGASTSAYQIEGAAAEDGRAPSIWDTFSHTPGRIATGETGDVACDHYHRYAADVDLIAAGGFSAYRFSIAWPRVMPAGTGPVNPAGLDFYDRLVDRLLAKGVAPWACLYHWDLPQALQERGGWTSREAADWFSDYVRAAVARLGDRVGHWIVLNEPNVHAIFGHAVGNHAPGLTGFANYAAAQHHQNLAQGRALSALRAEGRGLALGTVLSLQPIRPATGREADRAAAARFDAMWNRVNLDPLFEGRYPAVFEAAFAPLVRAGDLAAIRQPVDFLGINYYGPSYIVDDPQSVFAGASFGPLPAGMPVTAMGWPVDPEGLVDVLRDLKARYGNPPTYVTENGACYDDPAPAGGRVDDPARLAYIRDHLVAAANSIDHGCALRGYFAWSLLDNFEWAEGTRRRFGLVHVDFATQVRTPKASFAWLSETMKRQ
jgi:beta-glucosidase